MRLLPTMVALGLCTVGTGCTPLLRGVDNLYYESRRWFDERHENARNRHLAADAWNAYLVAHPGIVLNDDFAHGFKTGYADYLYAGGDGLGPPLPPRHYWTTQYQSPQGHEAIERWYAGFRTGAAEAKLSGRRDTITVPANAPLTLQAPPGLPPALLGSPPPPGALTAPPVAPELPAPRPVPRSEDVPAPRRSQMPETTVPAMQPPDWSARWGSAPVAALPTTPQTLVAPPRW